MFRPITFFIGLRYTRAKRRNHFISFVSMMSMFGIALGIIALITVLSVMNGFDREIKKHVFSMVPALTVSSEATYIENWQDLEKFIKKVPDVTAVAPYVDGQVLITNGGRVHPSLIRGIIPGEEKKISALDDEMIQGDLKSLVTGSFGIVLGADIANYLDVMVGDKVTVVTSEMSVSLAGVIPRFKRFMVTGIFSAGGGSGFDSMSFISLGDAQKLLEMKTAVSGLHVNINNVYAVREFANQLMQQLTPTARIMTWADQFGPFFKAVSLEKTMMFFILMLIIAVAVFNLVSTLVMVVNEKESDIAILRTIGATPRTIMGIFIVQGATIGIVGTLLGVIGGIALATHVTEIVRWIEHVLHMQFISSKIYYVDYLPSEIQWGDVLSISLWALGLSFLATIYPAWRASKTEPVEALRYE